MLPGTQCWQGVGPRGHSCVAWRSRPDINFVDTSIPACTVFFSPHLKHGVELFLGVQTSLRRYGLSRTDFPWFRPARTLLLLCIFLRTFAFAANSSYNKQSIYYGVFSKRTTSP